MLKDEKGEFSFIALISILFGSALVVGAAILNSTEDINSTFNSTLTDIIDNVSIEENQTINLTLNLTTQTEDIPLNQSINVTLNDTIDNQTMNISLPKKQKNLSEIIEKNKGKLNDETENYLNDVKDKKEVQEFIVKFKDSIDRDKLANVTLEEEFDKFRLTKVKGKIEDIESLIEDNQIEFLELEQTVEVLEDNLPFNIKQVKADSVWNLSKGSGVKIAVLDTGISSHDDLAIAGGVSFVDDNYFDSKGHGTSVAGVIAALLNDEGLVGIAPDVSLYSVKIMQSSTGELSNAIVGIEWAIDNNVSIVSMSFGFNSYSQIFKEVLEEAYNYNILLIAASGNNGQDNILYPARYDTVIAVGAVTSDNNLAYFSSYGFEQELVAPGVDINSTSLGNGYGLSSGTSLAAPHVAGVAALIKSYNNLLTNEQIRAKLRNDVLDLGDSGKDDIYGYGLVQTNLEVNNFTFINNSYLYEIFNITDFGLPNQTYWFWLNGTGTVDDVDFMPGYYLSNITFNDGSKKSKYYYVNENGTLTLLTITSLGFNDNYVGEGSTTDDAVVWINGNLKYNISNSNSERDAECFDDNNNDDPEACYYKTGKLTQCDTYSATGGFGTDKAKFHEVCDNSPPLTCTSGIPHNEGLDTSSRGQGQAEITEYVDCDNSAGQQDFDDSNVPFYYIIDAKRAICDTSANYHYEGRYSSTQWINYKSATCAYQCDTSLDDQIVTSSGGTIPDPCIPPPAQASTCNGSVNVAVDIKSGNFTGFYVYLNGVLNTTTNQGGTKSVNFTNVICGVSQTLAVYCSNNQSKLCEQKETSLDFNEDNDSLVFNCNRCNNNKNLELSLTDIDYRQVSGNTFEFNVTVNNENIGGTINITIKGQDKTTGLITREASDTLTLSSSETSSFKLINIDTTNVDYLHIYIDFNNNQIEADETDNYVIVPFIKIKEKAFLDINTGNSKADEAIRGYLKLFIQEVSENDAAFIIAVGKNASKVNSLNDHTRKNFKWYYDKTKNTPFYNEKPVGFTAYTGLVGRFYKDGKSHIFVYGKNIEGDIAAVKKLISSKNIMLTKDPFNIGSLDLTYAAKFTLVMDEKDVTGLAVMDLMHNRENHPYYNAKSVVNGQRFKDVVEDILLDNNFEISIKTVQTTNDNTTLRLKNVNTDYSTTFKDAIVTNQKPVVLSRGIHSNLLTWEDFAKDIATDPKNARDAWLIEMVGGPTIDEDCLPSGKYNCPNYTFSDLKTYYWPALIAGVEKYSGQNQIDYVGYSLGCSAALESLKLYGSSGKNNAGYYFDSNTGTYLLTDLASNPVDTFVAVACPGNFSSLSQLIFFLNRTNGDYNLYNNLKNNGRTHVKLTDIKNEILKYHWQWALLFPKTWAGIYLIQLPDDRKMSLEIYKEFLNSIANTTGPDVGKGVVVNNFMIMEGKVKDPLFNLDANTDLIVPSQDEKDTCAGINSSNKYYLRFLGKWHVGGSLFNIPDSDKVRDAIKEFLNNKQILQNSKNQQYIVSKQINCEPG